MLDIFNTNKYDDRIAIIDNGNKYTFSDFKNAIKYKASCIKNKKKNVVILADDIYNFILNFFASIYCGKNIFLLSDEKKRVFLDFSYDVLDDKTADTPFEIDFKNLDYNNVNINFFTSGTTKSPKIVKTSLQCLFLEAKDIAEENNILNPNMVVSATTSPCHRYGLVTHILFPLFSKMAIDTRSISYPDSLNFENGIFVSTPTFLNSILKFDNEFKVAPKIIFSAGSKLDDNVFKHFEKSSKVIEIYGSTETGDIAYKASSKEKLGLFRSVKIKPNKDNVEIESLYIKQGKCTINDNIKAEGRKVIFNKRTDRLYKIYEKRVSADELEGELKKNELVLDSYILKKEEKLACLCALSEKGRDFLLKNGVAEITKHLKRHLLETSEVVPQKWKYIDEIPMNLFGKKDKDKIEKLFNLNLSLPVVLDRALNKDIIVYKIFFYKSCDFFRGHFPNFKVLPGVVQLFFAKEFANFHFNLSLGCGQWKRIKFSNIIKADSVINLKIEKTEKNVCFEYYDDERKYSSGVFPLENIFKDGV